jgi:RNA polymerase sigma factor (sigma-70 family)
VNPRALVLRPRCALTGDKTSDKWRRPVETPSLNELMQMLQSGDALAFEALYSELKPSLQAFFSGRVNSSEIEDLVQETMFLIWKGRQSFNPESGQLISWAKRIALNTVTDSFRRNGRQRRGGEAKRLHIPLDTLADDSGEYSSFERIHSEMEMQIDQLPGDMRVACMGAIGGDSLQTVATTLGCSVTKTRLMLITAKSILSTSSELIDAVEMGKAV